MQRAVYKAIESRKRNENAFVRLLWIFIIFDAFLLVAAWVDSYEIWDCKQSIQLPVLF